MSNDGMVLLYSLRPPFTSVTAREDGAYIALAVGVMEAYAGTLRIPTEEVQRVLLEGFANTPHEIGFIAGGEVTWHILPELFGYRQVIDDSGGLHEVSKLGT